jgi:hypothetical protein
MVNFLLWILILNKFYKKNKIREGVFFVAKKTAICTGIFFVGISFPYLMCLMGIIERGPWAAMFMIFVGLCVITLNTLSMFFYGIFTYRRISVRIA